MQLKKLRNEGTMDRLVRLLIAEASILGAYFWLGGTWQIVSYAVGALSLITATTGFCALYKALGINTFKAESRPSPLYIKVIFSVLFIVIAVAGSYYSAFFTKKLFLDDYNRMNNYYKQALFYTGQEKRAEAMANYDHLTAEYSALLSKYASYHPHAIKSDGQFNADIEKASVIITSLKDAVYTGDLKQSHTSLEAVRPIFQDILKRNGFSMLAVALVDFHDAMEKIIAAADAKDAAQVLAVYPEVDTKLKAVEETLNDNEIQAIRAKLEEVATLAKNGRAESLSAKAAELKSAFVKVYLKRG
jgi:Protein of unknown function (DUF2892)